MQKPVMNSIFQDSAQYEKSHDVHVRHVASHSRRIQIIQTIRPLNRTIGVGLDETRPWRLQPVREGGLINGAVALLVLATICGAIGSLPL